MGTGVLPGESYATKESDGEATTVDDRAGGVACHQVIEDARRAWEMPGRVVSTKPGAPRTGLAGNTASGRRPETAPFPTFAGVQTP